MHRRLEGDRAPLHRAHHRGNWAEEGARRNAGLDACTGDWILEVDADERVPAALIDEIRARHRWRGAGIFPGAVRQLHWRPSGPLWLGGVLGVSAAPVVGARCQRWVTTHPSAPAVDGPKRWLKTPIDHYVDSCISDMIQRLDRYTTARAQDLRESGDIGTFANNLRRMVSRFLKCYLGRKGYREGHYGFLIALFAALYPILSYLKASWSAIKGPTGCDDSLTKYPPCAMFVT